MNSLKRIDLIKHLMDKQSGSWFLKMRRSLWSNKVTVKLDNSLSFTIKVKYNPKYLKPLSTKDLALLAGMTVEAAEEELRIRYSFEMGRK